VALEDAWFVLKARSDVLDREKWKTVWGQPIETHGGDWAVAGRTGSPEDRKKKWQNRLLGGRAVDTSGKNLVPDLKRKVRQGVRALGHGALDALRPHNRATEMINEQQIDWDRHAHNANLRQAYREGGLPGYYRLLQTLQEHVQSGAPTADLSPGNTALRQAVTGGYERQPKMQADNVTMRQVGVLPKPLPMWHRTEFQPRHMYTQEAHEAADAGIQNLDYLNPQTYPGFVGGWGPNIDTPPSPTGAQ